MNSLKIQKYDVQSIVALWLKQNGYDGLSDQEECGCSVNDIAPCAINGEMPVDCVPAYLNSDTQLFHPANDENKKMTKMKKTTKKYRVNYFIPVLQSDIVVAETIEEAEMITRELNSDAGFLGFDSIIEIEEDSENNSTKNKVNK